MTELPDIMKARAEALLEAILRQQKIDRIKLACYGTAVLVVGVLIGAFLF